MRSAVALLVLVALAPAALADTLFLKGGGRLEGSITKETETEVVIRLSGGTLTVPRDRIVQIRRDGAEPPSPGTGQKPIPLPEREPPRDGPMAEGVQEQVQACLADLGGEDSRRSNEALRKLQGLSPKVTSLSLRNEVGAALLEYLRGYDGRFTIPVQGTLERYLDVIPPEKLLDAGRGGKTIVREVIVGLLKRVRGRAAADALVELLADESTRIRSQAFSALHDRNDAASALARNLGHKDEDVREKVLTLLLSLEGREVTGALCRALATADETDRIRIVGRLSVLKSRTAYGTLSTRLSRDPSPEVRRLCAEALAGLGGPAVEAKLKSALAAEKNVSVRRAIEGALASLEAGRSSGSSGGTDPGSSGSGRTGAKKPGAGRKPGSG